MPEENASSKAVSSVADRRGAERYPCSLPVTWNVLGSDDDRSGTAEVRDVSTAGIGLVLSSQVRAGDILVLQFRLPDGHLTRPMSVRVMYALEPTTGEWRVGCVFLRPLTQHELRTLLDQG
jgi:hypothetical protein